MPGRSKFELELEQLKNIAAEVRDGVRRMSPVIVEELKNFVKNPRTLSARIEERSPWLSRRFLGAASNFAEPFVAGMGLNVEALNEDSIEVTLPGGWRNQGEGGAIHAGAICTLGEFASRLYWEYHLDLRSAEMCQSRIQVRTLSRVRGDVRAVYRIAVSEREKILHRLRSDGRVNVESEVSVYDTSGKLVAQVEVEWEFERHLALGPGQG